MPYRSVPYHTVPYLSDMQARMVRLEGGESGGYAGGDDLIPGREPSWPICTTAQSEIDG